LRTSFYVDDCMAGANSLEDAIKVISDLKELLMAGGFQLRKWSSNDPRVLSKINDIDKEESMFDMTSELNIFLLALYGIPSLTYKVKTGMYSLDSKRKLLSEIS